MSLTITSSSVDPWQQVLQNTVREGVIADVSNCYQSILHIDVALGDTTFHTGSRIIVQCSSNLADDNYWTERQDFVTLVGTANVLGISNNPLNPGDVSIQLSNTTGFAAGAGNVSTILCLVVDSLDVTTSELVRVQSYILNTSLSIIDGVKYTHNSASLISNTAATFAVELPLGTLRARVLYDNTYTTAGASIYTRCRVTRVTSLS